VIVVVAPVPVIPPGLSVHVPAAGRPLRITLPVGAEQDAGCVMTPTTGAVGAEGAGSMMTFADSYEIHPAALVTVKL
jgi:hypothetical protein